MTMIQQFTTDTLPEHFKWQMRDFTRIVWDSKEPADMTHPLSPDRWHPRHFVIADGQFLLSATTVLWKMVDIVGQSYKMYGLGMVMTYPTHRKQGYGQQTVKAATDFIRQDATADMAWLQTRPELEQFYGAQGWTYMPDVTVLSGAIDQPVNENSWMMMLFLSGRAHQNRQQIEKATFYLDEHLW